MQNNQIKIAVHLRGGRGAKELYHNDNVQLEYYKNYISQWLTENNISDYVVFVASDSNEAIKFMQHNFKNVKSYDCHRTDSYYINGKSYGDVQEVGWNPPDRQFMPNKRAEIGEEALIESQLLSKCDIMFHHDSLIGISGGIASALTSTLCAQTGIKTIVVSMPIHQAPNQLQRAHDHIDWLKQNFTNVTSLEKDLTNIYDSFEILFQDDYNELALANSRARIRMTTLYQIAQSNNALVVGTGNKVEDFGVGFFTKYGDGGVDISPIADLMKSEVRELAKELNINKDILVAPPTDGLWGDDRTDEDQIGASYDELEWAMNYQGDIKDLLGKQKQIHYIFNKFNTQNKHKMQSIPVCKIKDLNG